MNGKGNENFLPKELEGDDYNLDDEVTRGAARVMRAEDFQINTAALLEDPLLKGMDAKAGLVANKPNIININDNSVPQEKQEKPVIRSRGGAVWDCRPRPVHKSFFYNQTSFKFTNGETLADLVEQVYQFCDREYTVEIQKVNPSKGTFNLGVFVKEALIMVKLRFWQDDYLVLEVERRDGEPLAFGMVYRTIKKYLQPDGDEAVRDNIADLDLSLDALQQQGIDFPAPEEDDWKMIIEECDCTSMKEEREHFINSADVAESIESLSSIAKTYEPEDLEFLSKIITEKKIGFVHNNYDVEKANSKYAQLWSMSSLLCHLARTPSNVEHLVKLVPLIDNEIRQTIQEKQLDTEGEDKSGKKLWFSIVNQLAFTFLTIIRAAYNESIQLPELAKNIEIPDDYASKYNKNMVNENKFISKSVDAQKHLNEAYTMITA